MWKNSSICKSWRSTAVLAVFRGGRAPLNPCVQKDGMEEIYPAYEQADIVVLASPLYYWNVSGQLKIAFDRLFAVAERNPNYANPVKDRAIIMAAEGDSAENWQPALDYYDSLVHFLNWHDSGKILAGGILKAAEANGRPIVDEARQFGASL